MLLPPLAVGLLTACTTGCAGLPASLDPVAPANVRAAASDPALAEGGDGLLADDRDPAPPTEPPPLDPAPPTVAARAVGTPGTHDAGTTALIAEELALAPAAERARLATEWATLDAAMVEQVIRIRRMVRQLDAKDATQATPTRAPAVDPYEAPAPGRVIPAGPHQVPHDADRPANSPMYDPQVRPAAYAPPTAPPTPASSPLFPGLPAGPEPAPLPEPTPEPLRPPTRTAEALPPPAALLTPGTLSRTPGLDRSPSYDPGPTGFGSPRPAPAGSDDFGGRLAGLLDAAKLRVTRLTEAARFAPADPAKRAAAERDRAEAEIQLRMLYLIAGDHGRALEAVPGLSPAEQEFWQHTFWALSTELDAKSMPNPADRATHAVAALRTAAVKLSERANLTLKNVNFCHRVDSFGNVETFERDEFTPNEPVLIYAEVENFTSERSLEGRFRTVLKSKVEIFRAGGTQLVETLPLDKPVTVDLCDSHRQDYFLIYELKVPARIGLGPHVMKLTVEDTLGGAVAETELNFTVK